ncbi:MAG: MCE family protein [Mycobacteriaceae bacterium]|nr:MCE family protein [Mycobacteriaceae bacterium]
MSRRLLTRVAAAAMAVVALTGCNFKGAYSLPLPGGSAGGSVYHVKAVFADVQDLVPMSAVRVNDVAVGDVTDITTIDDNGQIKALVSMRIKKSVHLPANATATLEQTTLLGEKYIAIDFPQNQAATGQLRDGAVIPYQRTSDLPDVEQLFGALSAVLNGGDLQDLQTINIEISKALTGREAAVKDALSQLDTFVTSLNGQRQQIVRALDALDRFSGQLAKGNADIATALDNLGPGLKVLADERAQFTTLLTDLANFGRVASHIIRSSRAQTVAGLRDLQPILQHLSAAGTNLPHALELLVTYPFPRNIDKAVPGDYNGLYLSFNADPVFCALVPLPLPTCPSKPVAPTSTGTSKPTTKTSGLTKKAKRLLKKLPKLPLPDPGNVLEQLLGGGLTGVGR